MGLVIAFIIVVGAYVGYHASQVTDTGEAHNIEIDSQIQAYYSEIELKQEQLLVLS